MELYAHNQMAYEALVPMLEQYRRAAVVHPTGTGKSFLAFQLIEDHPEARFLWLSPNDYIFENQRRNVGSQFPNVEFMTYTKLLRLSEETLGGAVAGVHHSGRISPLRRLLLGHGCGAAAGLVSKGENSGPVGNPHPVSGQLPEHGGGAVHRGGSALCRQ